MLRGDTVSPLPDADVVVDADEFERGPRGQRCPPVDADRRAAGARRLWPGELLPQRPVRGRGLEARATACACCTRSCCAVPAGGRAGRARPRRRGGAPRACARQHAEQGDRRAALRQFERLDRALRRELGVTPGRAVACCAAELLASRRAASRRSRRRRACSVGRDAELDGSTGIALRGRARARRSSCHRARRHRQVRRCCAWLRRARPRSAGWRRRRARPSRARGGLAVRAGARGARRPVPPAPRAARRAGRRVPHEIERALSGRDVTGWTGESGHQRLFVAAAELLRLAAAGHGLLLVVDDVHEADEATLRLLHYLSRVRGSTSGRDRRSRTGRPLRPALDAMRESLVGRGTAVPLELAPLADEDIRRAGRPRPARRTEVQLEPRRAARRRHPVRRLELARTASERRRSRSVRLARSCSAASRRCGHSLDQRVAVLGAEFDTDEFVAAAGVGEDEAYAHLDAALAAAWSSRPTPGYRFRHALVRDALLDGLPPHRLLPLHRRRRGAACARSARSPARIGHQLLAGRRCRRAPRRSCCRPPNRGRARRLPRRA